MPTTQVLMHQEAAYASIIAGRPLKSRVDTHLMSR
jgi:hypothetical protein